MFSRIGVRIDSPAAISALAVVPLLIMELVNRSQYNEPFPGSLFGALWLLGLIFVAALSAAVRTTWHGIKGVASVTRVLLLACVVALFGFELVRVVTDQWPCFMGVRLCD